MVYQQQKSGRLDVMHSLPIVCLLSLLAVEIPTTMAATPVKQAVAVRGLLLCGGRPEANVRLRLFRVQQKKKDDLNQMLDEKITTTQGTFLLEGNTNGFPLNETSMNPVVSIYHSCDEDIKNVDKNGYRKFDFHIPKDYVTMAAKPIKTYDLGKLNLQFIFPGENRVKKIDEKPTKPNPRKL
ncbi:hypothetical protein KIN20_037017 [Parelaphostrongylus tenuis]|uniref:Transthyretin-like family protein n=1 Tax=Parelaphostrongylus tenuis TaxID=148309 RepID=A0AAD5WLN8_PARTN|nr:hypothetical protein KIN20_037017 [Parelaphostrongylus tenuis]